MDNPKQIEDVKEFMLAIAPQIVQSSVATDQDAKTNAEITMRWAMHLSVTYETFRAIAEANIAETDKQSQGQPPTRILPTET